MSYLTQRLIEEKYGRTDVTLLGICLELHMYNTGSLDTLSFDEDFSVIILKIALDSWEESLSYCEEFDNAVKNLIVVTLKEYDDFRIKRILAK